MAFHTGIKKGLAAAAAMMMAVGFAGCSAQTEKAESLKVLSPMGAPALAAMNTAAEGSDTTIEYVEGQDVLISELSKEDSEYDIIFAPVNLGVKTWKESGTWQLEGIVTWGNLYVVSPDAEWNNPETRLAAFGEGAVPGMVFNSLFPEVSAQVTWYPSVSEASQALLSGNADAALLAQPAAGAAIAKGQEAGNSYIPAEDLQQDWLDAHDNTGGYGYPQAAVFIKKGTEKTTAKAIETMAAFLDNPSAEDVEAKVNEIGADILGVPSAKMAAATWNAQNIHYLPAKDVASDIQAFLDLFGMQLDESMIVQ